jgi:hypothetical protein
MIGDVLAIIMLLLFIAAIVSVLSAAAVLMFVLFPFILLAAAILFPASHSFLAWASIGWMLLIGAAYMREERH